MHKHKPSILIPNKRFPSLHQPPQFRLLNKPTLNRLIPESTLPNPVRPRAAPPSPLLFSTETPPAGPHLDPLPREPGFACQHVEPASRVRRAARLGRDAQVQVPPVSQARGGRVPGGGGAVGFARGDEAAGFGHAAHLAQGGGGRVQVLEDLMHVHDIEGCVRVLELVDVADRERYVSEATLGRVLAGLREHRVGRVEADYGTLWDEGG